MSRSLKVKWLGYDKPYVHEPITLNLIEGSIKHTKGKYIIVYPTQPVFKQENK